MTVYIHTVYLAQEPYMHLSIYLHPWQAWFLCEVSNFFGDSACSLSNFYKDNLIIVIIYNKNTLPKFLRLKARQDLTRALPALHAKRICFPPATFVFFHIFSWISHQCTSLSAIIQFMHFLLYIDVLQKKENVVVRRDKINL